MFKNCIFARIVINKRDAKKIAVYQKTNGKNEQARERQR